MIVLITVLLITCIISKVVESLITPYTRLGKEVRESINYVQVSAAQRDSTNNDGAT